MSLFPCNVGGGGTALSDFKFGTGTISGTSVTYTFTNDAQGFIYIGVNGMNNPKLNGQSITLIACNSGGFISNAESKKGYYIGEIKAGDVFTVTGGGFVGYLIIAE